MSVEYLKLSTLEAVSQTMTLNEQRSVKAVAVEKYSRVSGRRKDTFLSHSSKDKELLPGVIRLLENHGASVYCDMDDDRMPENPNPETAEILKSQIAESTRLVVFVTPHTKDSKWVPWELGIGDAKLNHWNVALLPAVESDYESTWTRQEYLGLYRHIVRGNFRGSEELEWMVRDYRTQSATPLRDWCRSY